MKYILPLAAFTASMIASPVVAEEEIYWTYDGERGSANWSQLAEEFSACGLGREQSPIDLTGGLRADAPDPEIRWNPQAEWTLENTGHTIQANATDGGAMIVDGREYALLQFHFHIPSEHAIEGSRTPMEVHFVHKAEDGALAVLGVMIEGGGEHALFDSVMAAAPGHVTEVDLGAADATTLLPASEGFYRYHGSLTTPPCSETVLWTVLREPVAVSDTAIAAFEELFAMNARPIQPVNRRFLLIE